ncbi:hypothetical protein EDEG_03222 [Edhazardia aedis USNM 41457]|uniref:Uncharacterized protein n=1 Tax=Edhazardia aedis (strain USNM 41457) TaxID=1003232 RepID=J9DLT9_EDHAE|nr:hypothetical protein EDEG_03222 [Edhazardia aedis USNM 41457]|eukprot:EJW02347.1 hypothetical protein EDEG_03222 [Edhazardia aedis USNM 41457]
MTTLYFFLFQTSKNKCNFYMMCKNLVYPKTFRNFRLEKLQSSEKMYLVILWEMVYKINPVLRIPRERILILRNFSFSLRLYFYSYEGFQIDFSGMYLFSTILYMFDVFLYFLEVKKFISKLTEIP